MREKVVLPKFRVPGMRSHWAMRALWIVGGLVLVQMGVFALIIMRQPGAEAADVSAANAAPAAPVTASAPAATETAPAPVTAKPAGKPAEAPAATASAESAPLKGKRFRRHSYRHARRSSAASAKVLAKAGGPAKQSKKTDAIDELLKRFK
jgi:hypothetical protein